MTRITAVVVGYSQSEMKQCLNAGEPSRSSRFTELGSVPLKEAGICHTNLEAPDVRKELHNTNVALSVPSQARQETELKAHAS